MACEMTHHMEVNCFGAFENNQCWVIVLDYARGGNLDVRLLQSKQFSERVTAHYLRCDSYFIVPKSTLQLTLDLEANARSNSLHSLKAHNT